MKASYLRSSCSLDGARELAPAASDTESYRDNADAKPLNAAMMKWFWGHYLANPSDGSKPLASPLRASLRGMPPTTVVTAEIDPLRSESRAYAEALRKAGVDVKLHEFRA